MKKPAVVYSGWIGASLEDRPLLESMGFKIGRYDAPTQSFLDVECDLKAIDKLKADKTYRCFGLTVNKMKTLEKQANEEFDLF